MRRITWFVCVLVLALLADAAALRAQAFQGSGQEATELFSLSAGLVVFEAEHRGPGAFTVRLLDEQGRVVEEVANATGEFRGSKAVRVPQDGRYLLDVAASGPWSVRRRDPGAAPATAAGAATAPDPTASPVFTQGWEAGQQAASAVATNAWLARGFVGGALAGPIGAGLVVGLAGRSGIEEPAPANGATAAEYEQGYRDGFAARVREQRRKKAFIGGMLGSGIFLAALVYAIDIAEGGKGGATVTDPSGGGGGVFVRVPR